MDPVENSVEDLAMIRQGLGVTDAFSSWPPAVFDRLIQLARLGRYVRGDLVHSEASGEPELLVVVSGSLMVGRMSEDGAGSPVHIIGPGVVEGMTRALNLNDEARYKYHAHNSAVIVHVPARALMGMLDATPALWMSIARKLLGQDAEIFTTLADHLTGELRRRLAATIARLAEVYGVDKTTLSLRLRLSQDDLAALVQASRGAVNREMRTFEDLGLLRAEYGAVTIYDMEALHRFGGQRSRSASFGQRGPTTKTSGISAADAALVRQGLMNTASFADWPPAAIDALILVSHLYRYESGAFVRSDIDGVAEVLIVLSGHLIVSRVYPNLSRAPVFILKPGDVTGIHPALRPAAPWQFSCEAHGDTVIARLSGQAMLDRLDADPPLWGTLARPIFKYQREFFGTLLDHQSGSIQRRLVATIIRLAQVFGIDDTRTVRVRLSQDDLALMLQAGRQSINREMRTLERMGLIRIEYGAVAVLQLSALKGLMGNSEDVGSPSN